MHFEGLSRVREDDLRRQEFGSYSFSDELQYWYGPCVARGQFTNGFLVIDTTESTVAAARLIVEAVNGHHG